MIRGGLDGSGGSPEGACLPRRKEGGRTLWRLARTVFLGGMGERGAGEPRVQIVSVINESRMTWYRTEPQAT